jgi:hypothetical protein
MKIEVPFAPGDRVWLLHAGKAADMMVFSVTATVMGKDKPNITYRLDSGGVDAHVSKMFKTKKALLDSL